MRSDIFPMKREITDNTQNLDLNTTARKNERTVEKASPYLINATYTVVIAELSHPIGTFVEEVEIEKLKKQKLAELNAGDDNESRPPT